ncbi:hypothetical protein AMATHDRAFT_151287, partial [Amanita thiersii Skay4041]
ESQIDSAASLFADLMKDDLSGMTISGGEVTLMPVIAQCMIRAATSLDERAGQFYLAVKEHGSDGQGGGGGEVVGFVLCMPPGEDMFSTPEQRALGYDAFVRKIPAANKDPYETIFRHQFPSFIARILGPTFKRDCWWVNFLMVHRAYQGQHIATQLINLIRKKAKESPDLRPLGLITGTDHNVVFYQRLGFELKGTLMISAPWGDWPLHVLVLTKP